jgi:hypothetical protein
MILAEAYDITGNTANNKFTDVNSRYLAAVSALKDNGITSGKSSTRFGTNDAITRGELAIWVYKLETLGALTVSNLNVAVDGSKATVTADVKNAEANADATVSVYPNGNLSATPIVNTVKVVGGKVSSVFNEVPAGNHTVVVKVGDVSSSKSFTIAAAPAPIVKSAFANADTGEITLIFSKALDSASASQVRNYLYDNDKANTINVTEFPESVSVNTDFVGPYAPGQVVTLKYTVGKLKTTDSGELNVQNLKDSAGKDVSAFKVNINPVSTTDTGNTLNVRSLLKSGTQEAYYLTVNSGTNVDLEINSGNDESEITSLRYRLQRPDKTFTAWTSVNAKDGSFDELYEDGSAVINTTGFTGGDYTVYTEVVDAQGNVKTNSTNTTLNIVRKDIDGPSYLEASGSYNSTSTSSKPANSVSISGQTQDFGAENNIAKVEYLVQSYNGDTNTFSPVGNWTTVAAADGAFNEAYEEFAFTTAKLNYNAKYIIQVRSTDVKGNVSKTLTVKNISGLTPAPDANGLFTTPSNSAGDNAAPVVVVNAPSDTSKTNVANGQTTNDTQVVLEARATDNVQVSSVEYAVYRDADANGSYETLVQDYTANGVAAANGTFNEASEVFTITYNTPAVDGAYKVLVRSSDNSGNVSGNTAWDYKLDTTAPTLTAVPNTATASDLSDFVITFNEDVNTTIPVPATNGFTSASVYDFDNYTIQQDGQVVTTNTVADIVSVEGSKRKFIVKFTNVPANGQTINITAVKDVAGNTIAPAKFTVSQ